MGTAHRTSWVVSILVAAAGACGDEELNPASTRVRPPAAADGVNGSGVGAGSGADTGLPCEVQQLLENRCIGCHLSSSPPALLTYEDLAKPSPADPSRSLAERSLERMRDAARPMPPAPAEAPAPEEIATMQAWVEAKLPRGTSCGTAGAPTTSPFDTRSVCTSQTTWTRGESSSMRPGEACITCHTMRGGPAYKVAGTVYPTAHEPNDCNGIGGALSVVVTDAKGAVTTIKVNSAGNFSARGSIVPPFRVKVTDGTRERAMVGAVTAGDCNTCHTEQGLNGAPGRIVAP